MKVELLNGILTHYIQANNAFKGLRGTAEIDPTQVLQAQFDLMEILSVSDYDDAKGEVVLLSPYNTQEYRSTLELLNSLVANSREEITKSQFTSFKNNLLRDYYKYRVNRFQKEQPSVRELSAYRDKSSLDKAFNYLQNNTYFEDFGMSFGLSRAEEYRTITSLQHILRDYISIREQNPDDRRIVSLRPYTDNERRVYDEIASVADSMGGLDALKEKYEQLNGQRMKMLMEHLFDKGAAESDREVNFDGLRSELGVEFTEITGLQEDYEALLDMLIYDQQHGVVLNPEYKFLEGDYSQFFYIVEMICENVRSQDGLDHIRFNLKDLLTAYCETSFSREPSASQSNEVLATYKGNLEQKALNCLFETGSLEGFFIEQGMEVDQRRYFALGISALLQDYLAIANSKSLRLHHEAKYKAKANVSTSALSPQQQDVVSLLEQKAREGRGLMEKQVQYFVEYLDNITDMLSQVVYHEEGDKDLVTLAFRHRGEDEDISSHLSSMGMDHRLRVRCVTDSQLHVAHYSNDSRIRPDRLCIQGGDVLFIGAGIAEFKARQMVRRFTQDPCGEVSQGGAISLDRTDNYVTIPVTTASGNGVIISSEDRELFGPHEDRKEEPNVFVRIARRFIGASGTSTREQHPSSTEVVVTPLDETPQQYVSHGGQNLFLQRSPSGERLYLGTEDNFFQREPVYCLETRELDKPIEFCKRDLPSDISTQVVVDFFKHIDQGKIKQADIFTDGEFNLQKAIDKMRRIQVSMQYHHVEHGGHAHSEYRDVFRDQIRQLRDVQTTKDRQFSLTNLVNKFKARKLQQQATSSLKKSSVSAIDMSTATVGLRVPAGNMRVTFPTVVASSKRVHKHRP